MKRLIALFLLSLGLGLGGLYLATREALFSPATYAPTELSPGLLALAVVMLLALWGAPVVKLMVLARAQGIRVAPGNAFMAHVAQVFGSAMTPSGTGGGPLLLLALERVGVPAGTGLGIAVQLFVLDLATLGVLIPVGLVYLLAVSPIALSPLLSWLAGAAALVALAGSVALVLFPRPLTRLIHALSRWRPLARFARGLKRMAGDYHASARAFRGMPFATWLGLLAVNLAAWLANFALFWALLAMYGAQVKLLDVLSVLSIITLFAFFVPTPGASGVLELLLGLGLSGGAQSSIAAPVLWWRAGTFYLAYLLGPICAWVLLAHNPPKWLRRRRRTDSSGAA